MCKYFIVIIALVLAGCGVEMATTAATGAAIKKQEVEDGKRTMEQAQARVSKAMEQVQERADKDAEK